MNSKNTLFSSLKNKLDSGGYYTIAKDKMGSIEYSDLSIKPLQDIYIMRKFQQEPLDKFFNKQLTEEQRYYRENGYIILKGFIPHELIDRYLELRESLNMGRNSFQSDDTAHRVKYPYVTHQCIRDIACYRPMVEVIKHLHSMEMGLIFSLTAFRSTERGWHQDSYLDSDDAVPRCASWIALGDISTDSGPFEFIPESNNWPALSNQKINQFLKEGYRWPEAHRQKNDNGPRWGRLCEKFIDPAVDKKIEMGNHTIKQFNGKKGDLLIWYGRLMHRGSTPLSIKTARPALISHYAPPLERGRGLFAKRKDGSYFLLPPSKLEQIKGHSDIL